MQEIRCPNCGEVFQVDETGYDQIARQVRDKEFSKELERREKELEARQEKELELIMDENETLAAKIESKNSIANVEEIAVGQLNMVKLQEYQIHYVNLAEDDSVEIASDTEKGSFFDGIVASFNILLEYLN